MPPSDLKMNVRIPPLQTFKLTQYPGKLTQYPGAQRHDEAGKLRIAAMMDTNLRGARPQCATRS
jgi:hypothetical protein